MLLKIHRGTHEIGGICIEVQSKTSRIIIDIGLPLFLSKNKEDFTKFLPELQGAYKWDKAKNSINALLVTHSHMDHYGFIENLKPEIPVICGKATSELMQFTGKMNFKEGLSNLNFIFVEHCKTLKIGDFSITPFLMDHSAFDSYGYLIEAENKKLFYTGDFRGHGRKKGIIDNVYEKIKALDVLIIEGTNICNTDKVTDSEAEIEKVISEVSKNTEGFVFFNTSSQNIDRLVTLFRVALTTERILLIDLYTAMILDLIHRNTQSIPDTLSGKFDNIKVFYNKRTAKHLIETFGKEETIYKFKNNKVVWENLDWSKKYILLVRPPILADLKVISRKYNPKIFENSTLVYSQWKGYLKENKTQEFIDAFKEKGSEVKFIHTSGHATTDLIQQTIKKLNPRVIIPIHTEKPEVFREFDSKVKVLEDKEPFFF